MIQSPCRNCPNRDMDKNICALSCKLISRLQMFEASNMARASYTAIDSCDPERYQLTVAFDLHTPELSSLGA